MIPDGEGVVGRLNWCACATCQHDEDGQCADEALYIDGDAEVVRCRGYQEEES